MASPSLLHHGKASLLLGQGNHDVATARVVTASIRVQLQCLGNSRHPHINRTYPSTLQWETSTAAKLSGTSAVPQATSRPPNTPAGMPTLPEQRGKRPVGKGWQPVVPFLVLAVAVFPLWLTVLLPISVAWNLGTPLAMHVCLHDAAVSVRGFSDHDTRARGAEQNVD